MNRLSQNELLGVVAIQSALEHAEVGRLSLGKIMLVLPLLFDKATRSVLKNKRRIPLCILLIETFQKEPMEIRIRMLL